MKSTRALLRQGGNYGIVGVLVLSIDWAVFVVVSGLGIATVPANLAGRVVGACLSFWLNGVHTFRDADGARLGWRRFARFAAIWGVLSTLSSLAVLLIDERLGLTAAWLAKPAVDALLAGTAFLASRHWVYR